MTSPSWRAVTDAWAGPGRKLGWLDRFSARDRVPAPRAPPEVHARRAGMEVVLQNCPARLTYVANLMLLGSGTGIAYLCSSLMIT